MKFKLYSRLFCVSVFLLAFAIVGRSQNEDQKGTEHIVDEKKNIDENPTQQVEVNFLLNYYDQDGSHSAVTGGVGTEKLEDRAMKIIVNVPLDSITVLNVSTHTNYYTSASTDRIDTHISSASRHDLRVQFDIGYDKFLSERNKIYGFKAGGSMESDYISTYVGANWSKSSENKNQQVGVIAQAYFDTWLPIFPEELRDTDRLHINTNKRYSYHLALNYSRVINKKIQTTISGEFIYQRGLLSTPFHRVYFVDDELPGIERLPAKRFKYPIGLRFNYFASDYLILRLYYRYYFDSFGVEANTVNIEIPIKLGNFFSIYPFYRFHNQAAIKYFRPYKEHVAGELFYTSDYDLSAFKSNKYGIGIHFAPVWGIGRFNFLSRKKITNFKSFDLRYAIYNRSDGLRSFIISADFSFSIN